MVQEMWTRMEGGKEMNASKILLLLVILMACVTPALAVGKFYENKIVPYDGVAEFNALP